MNKIDQLKRFYTEPDFDIWVVDAPKDAQTFDKMLVIFVNERTENQWLAGLPRDYKPARKIIRSVKLYNSETDTIVLEY